MDIRVHQKRDGDIDSVKCETVIYGSMMNYVKIKMPGEERLKFKSLLVGDEKLK